MDATPQPQLQHVAQMRCEYAARPMGVETLSPRLTWQIESPRRGVRQSAYQVQVASTPDLLAAGRPDLWDSGKVASAQSVHVPYAGAPLKSRQRCWWRVRAWDERDQPTPFSAPEWWEMGLLSPADWQAQWIGAPGRCLNNWEGKVLPAPLLRKTVRLDQPVRSARAYVCGLGYHELHVNGRKVGDHVLDPAVTRYDRRAAYVVHDITEACVRGENVFGAVLGNGWYNCHTADVWHFDKASWRDYPKLLLQVEITFADGSTRVVASDGSWKVSDGPIRFDGLRNGETYDARKEKPGWSAPGYDDRSWAGAAIVPGPGGVLSSQQMPPCKVMQTIAPVRVSEVRPGVFVFDLGRNIAGWAQLTVSGPAGTEVKLRYAEKLQADGDINEKDNAQFVRSGDFQTDRYLLKGEGVEVWEPRFTYHGFQYVQVTGFPGTPTLESLRGRVVHTAFERAGRFECSNPLLNRIQECTEWAYIGNYVGIPTDCPHREKNGWTGDAQLAAETGLLNFAAAPAYAKWLEDLADEQRPSGQFPGIVPSTGWGYNWGSGPAWDSAYLLIPWYLYLYCGDTGILERHYEGMKRYVDFLGTMARDHVLSFGLGDWCPVDQKRMAPAALTSTGYYAVDCRIVAEAARLLGKEEDARRYAALAEQVARAFRERFGQGEGRYAGGEQTSLGCALYQDLAAPEEREAVLSRLVEAIGKNEGRLDFGILGHKYVLNALAEGGRMDVAYAMVNRTDYPGWGHWISKGATTLWEHWSGGASRNHIMFGDISAWMVKHVAGIAPDPEAPGFRRIRIHPQPVGDLTSAGAEHHSPYGLIRSAWRLGTEGFHLEVRIPANTEARVVLPAADAGAASEGGKPLAGREGILSCTPGPEGLVARVGSGEYAFQVARPTWPKWGGPK